MATNDLARSHATSAGSVVRRLDAEWAALRHDRRALLRANGWRLVDVAITDLDEMLVALGLGRPGCRAADARLHRAVAIAAHDGLAGRVVLQRLLPGLVAAARRSPSVRDALDELAPAAWLAVVTFNPARAPRCLAAALIDDARDRAIRQPARRASAAEVVDHDALDQRPWAPSPHPIDELARLLADTGPLPVDDRLLLGQLLSAPSIDHVADALSVTARTVRNRRSQLTDRLRERALAA